MVLDLWKSETEESGHCQGGNRRVPMSRSGKRVRRAELEGEGFSRGSQGLAVRRVARARSQLAAKTSTASARDSTAWSGLTGSRAAEGKRTNNLWLRVFRGFAKDVWLGCSGGRCGSHDSAGSHRVHTPRTWYQKWDFNRPVVSQRTVQLAVRRLQQRTAHPSPVTNHPSSLGPLSLCVFPRSRERRRLLFDALRIASEWIKLRLFWFRSCCCDRA